MKKNVFLLSLSTIAIVGLVLTGCSKDDTTAPAITLTGASSIELSLGSGAWSDPGATATDDEDGAVTVTSDASSSNPNTNRVGTYTVTYTASDKAGNVQIEVRTIRVKNDAENFAGSYLVRDSVVNDTIYNYPQVISVDSTVNNRVHFDRFADYANNTSIFATKLSSGSLELLLQTAANIGSGSGSCAISDHQFQGVQFTSLTNGFLLKYTDANTSTGCTGTVTAYATYTKQ